jgi:hypothetical protein
MKVALGETLGVPSAFTVTTKPRRCSRTTRFGHAPDSRTDAGLEHMLARHSELPVAHPVDNDQQLVGDELAPQT